MTDNTRTAPPSGRPPWTPPEGVSEKRAWASLAVLMVGLFMSLLDTTIVNVALPTIRDSINADEATLAWIISGYALAFGLVLIPAGRIGDSIGHKWVFFAGLALFTAASLFAGVAQDPTQLIVARVLQGLGGGIFFPPVTAFIQLLFPPTKRGKAFAILGAVLGVSSALGPIVGGLLIEAFGEQSGWRYIFFVNLPIGVAGMVAAAIVLPKLAPGVKLSLDGVGLLLLAGSLVAILVPLIQGQEEGWPLWTYLSIVAGIVLLVLFALWERRLAARGISPLVPPRLFSHAAFTGGTILALVYFAAFTSIFFTIALLWQAGLGHTALESGLVTIPFAIGNIVAASQSDRLAQKLGRGVLVLGAGMVFLGLVSLWILFLTVPGADLTNWMLLGPMLVAGLGNGFFIAPNSRFIVATVDQSEAGAASGVIGTMQRIGSAIGIAVVSSVLFAVANLGGVADEVRQKVGAALKAGTYSTPELAGDAISKTVLAAHVTDAATVAMFVSACFALVALALVFTLPRRVQLH
ncbi:MFS transporter [Salinibacterium xinjiangense]|uniref:Drug resistance transporter, EmrB/QacA subfamily n=1 Tax=Salinibacterium xinjiangense TaxID=386302 RepID=A0A2C8ZJR0_9MICO|nr:MFS transporter [Salinibacterium xinjiangense]GGK88601.1 MFS transporter [Salinibacterium xinjiangense]SOE65005.1 drug resistance transporter, EmrB/QacA subfamily [Salinibacterium xinjiangense]